MARVRSRRSCLGPGRVRSWGRTWPASKSSTRTRDEDAVAGVAARRRGRCSPGSSPRSPARVLDQRARLAPGLDRLRGRRVGIALALLRPGLAVGLRQVDRDRVVGRALQQLGPLRGVDHVIGRSRDVLQRADRVEVVVQGVEGRTSAMAAKPSGRRRRPRPVGALDWAPRGVAQPGSAPPLGGGGPRFESGHPDCVVSACRGPPAWRRHQRLPCAGAGPGERRDDAAAMQPEAVGRVGRRAGGRARRRHDDASPSRQWRKARAAVGRGDQRAPWKWPS